MSGFSGETTINTTPTPDYGPRPMLAQTVETLKATVGQAKKRLDEAEKAHGQAAEHRDHMHEQWLALRSALFAADPASDDRPQSASDAY